MASNVLKDTQWLASRLGLSVSTVERLRSEKSPALPPCVRLGSVYRYDMLYCEYWLQARLTPEIDDYEIWSAKNAARFLS